MTPAEDADVAGVVVNSTLDAVNDDTLGGGQDGAVGWDDDARRVEVDTSVELRAWRWRRGRNSEYANVKQPELAEMSTHRRRGQVDGGTG